VDKFMVRGKKGEKEKEEEMLITSKYLMIET
jgi:hypothetical protein